jgi:hypothetical protein
MRDELKEKDFNLQIAKKCARSNRNEERNSINLVNAQGELALEAMRRLLWAMK